jgi:hypothetical protein
MAQILRQSDYPALEFDASEKDHVQIWMKESEESNVIMIERGKLKEVIEILTAQLK